MSQRITLNDPTTWDLSQKELEQLAASGAVEEEEPLKEEPPKEEPPKQRPLVSPPEAEGILAADGKNVIPYTVLRSTRDELNAAKAALEETKAQLQAVQAQAQQQAPAAPVAQDELPDAVKEQVETARKNWGDDIAAQVEQTYRLEQHVLRQQQLIEQLSQYVNTQQSVQTRTEQEQIEDAIAASPTLDAWAKAEDQSLFDHAVEVHATLMKIDRNYKAMTWFDRMRVLPAKVEALAGKAPAAEPLPASTPVDPTEAKRKVESAMSATPTSLSDMTGGTLPEKSEFDRLEDLSGNQLTAYMDKLARDPRKFEAYLRSMS